MGEQKKLDDYFEEVFDKGNDVVQDENTSLSPMAKKLKQRKERGIVDGYLSWLALWGKGGETISSCNNDNSTSYRHSLAAIHGKHFSEPVDKNYATALYEVFISYSHETKTKNYYVRKVYSAETAMSDGCKYVTYFIDRPEPTGNQIVLLHFNKTENLALMN